MESYRYLTLERATGFIREPVVNKFTMTKVAAFKRTKTSSSLIAKEKERTKKGSSIFFIGPVIKCANFIN